MTVERIDHIAQAHDLMLFQHEGKETTTAILDSWINPIQSMEDSLLDMMSNSGITNAQGEMLNIIGGWMGVDRNGRADPEYRTAILGQAAIINADGTAENLLETMRVLGSTNYVTFEEYYPHTVYACMGDGYNNETIIQLRKVIMAGTHLRLKVSDKLSAFVMADTVTDLDQLITESGDDYQVDIGGIKYNLVTNSNTTFSVIAGGNYFAELFDTSGTPLADVVVRKASVNSGYLVDVDGNYIVDGDGNYITVVSLS